MATTTTTTATGYGPRSRLMFDGDERKYELWEIKFLGFMKIRDLDEILQNLDDEYQIERSRLQAKKNEEVFAELVQVLDDRSLSLIIRDARNDGRAALRILREHYQPRGKP
ncbi:CCHC-type zinc finger, nucleic acid binding protein a [Elysia marginata]|uniref:CCHC-type zinc finger, nucleic acid binding protein a n=1 Tax=Elysia marginata TaxID=1093978 RepID=A0AAV4FS02_9GAST|nr:CCHC-type zinc finger, nucleic acid binding protein a [Elysia marginata]